MKEFPSVPPAATGSYEHAVDTASRAVELTGDGATKPSHRPPAAPAESLPAIAGYSVVRKIGEGGMGAVYLAEDTRLGRRTAIKTMKAELAGPSDRDRFVREARAAAAVEHDNIVPVWQVGEAADGSPFIAMPFLQGEMLDDRLKRQPVANLGIILKVAVEVAAGLSAAHAKGLIHRDIKPGNVWLEGDLAAKELAKQIRRCKILDFGLARSVDKDDAQITASGAILGTPAYMAPEQARGEKVDHRADLFSLGVLLYRMATGRLPFRGPNAMAVLIALATETPPPVRELNPNVPPALAGLIDRLMSKDPAARPQSAAEVSAAVRQIVKEVQNKRAPSPSESSSQPVPVYLLPTPAANPWEDVTEEDAEAVPVAKTPKAAKRSRAPWFAAAGVLALLAMVAVLAVVIIRMETAEGTLVVEINDPAVEARIKNGKLVLVDADGKDRYTITPAERDKKIDAGAYTIRVEGADGLTLDTREFTMKKGDTVAVRVTLAPKAVAKKPEPPKDGTKLTTFRETHGATLAELEKWMKSLRDDGFIPSYLSGEAGPGVRFTAVAVPNPAKTQWRFIPRVGLGTPEGQRTWDAQTAAGFRLAFICPHPGDPPFESHVWAADGQGWVMWYGSRDHILGKLKEGPGDKTRPVLVMAEPHTDGTTFRCLMAPDAGLDWEARLDLTGEELAAVVAKQKGKGWRPDWLSAYRDGDRLPFQAVFVENPGGIEWDFQMGLTAKAYEERLAAAGPKSRPLSVAGYTENGQTRYAVVWSTDERKADADRKAAEYVLTIGGRVGVNDGETEETQLPTGPFRLTGVNLWANAKVTAEGLAVFADCRSVAYLWLNNARVTDAGLAHFKNCTALAQLHLHGTPVTDKGLAYFRGRNTLTHVNVGRTAATDEGVAYFRDCANLTELWLYNTRATDAALAHAKGWKQLAHLVVQEVQVTDAGLEHLKGCGKLTWLEVRKTQVTAKGVADLAKAMPQCKIEWDGGTIEPAVKLDADRKAAEYVLAAGGTVQVNGDDTDIKAAKDLPKAAFRLTAVELRGDKRVDDAGAAAFAGCRGLFSLSLEGTGVGDKGLANFAGCTDLQDLNLKNTPLTDAGLVHFKDCKRLAYLKLERTAATDKGLVNFTGCKDLTSLDLDSTAVTAAGLAHFKESTALAGMWLNQTAAGDAALAALKGFPDLQALYLNQTPVTDAGLAHLKGCAALRELEVSKTKVTAQGVAELAKALPQCQIKWDGGTIELKK